MLDDFTTIYDAGNSDSKHQENYFLYPVDNDDQLKREVVDAVKALCDDLVESQNTSVEYYRIFEWSPDEYQSIDEHPNYEDDGWDKSMFFDWVKEQYVETLTEDGHSPGTHLPVRTDNNYMDQLSKSVD